VRRSTNTQELNRCSNCGAMYNKNWAQCAYCKTPNKYHAAKQRKKALAFFPLAFFLAIYFLNYGYINGLIVDTYEHYQSSRNIQSSLVETLSGFFNAYNVDDDRSNGSIEWSEDTFMHDLTEPKHKENKNHDVSQEKAASESIGQSVVDDLRVEISEDGSISITPNT
jgi:hypothetical protein